MSKSRLEKFLYALYSLDSSDLPNPLSRIEELYKCLVTGDEAPTFEPLSRVEKYLMAILGIYDADELPNPISRVEVLLYKLATGDDNLDDFKSFLSEHEELLAEIIRNGGVGGNIDIEYVLYTLSTEFNTLYNTAEKPVKSAILKGQTLVNVHPTDYIVAGSNPTFFLSKIIPKTMIKPNTRYFLRLYNTHQSVVSAFFKPCVKNRVDLISSDNKCAVFTTKSEFADSDFNNNKIHFYSSSNLTLEDVKDTKVILCEYVDGMENWDIPYFEGMQSVKMPVLTTSNEDGTKTNILMVNEPVELRGIGDVQDTLDLLTGELTQRVGEIVLDGSEEGWILEGFLSNDEIVYFKLEDIENIKTNVTTPTVVNALIDKLKVSSYLRESSIKSESYFQAWTNHFIGVSRNKLITQDVNGFKQWLSDNNLRIKHQLSENSVKTVDLSVVDQDGNNTKLSTFDDITHVTLFSEGLIPEAELKVATKNEEVLNTMSLEMDDISTTQNALQKTSNTQSENVDATMLATTEIYEGLL